MPDTVVIIITLPDGDNDDEWLVEKMVKYATLLIVAWWCHMAT